MSDKLKKIKVKTSAKSSTDTEENTSTITNKLKSSDVINKAKSTIGETADKVKSSEAFDKAKNAVNEATDKVKSSEAFDKAKNVASEAAEKIGSSEIGNKAKEAIDNVKSKENIKANKIIKIGAIALVIIIVACTIIPKIGLHNKEAQQALEDYTATLEYTDVKIKLIDSYKGTPTDSGDRSGYIGKVYIFNVEYTDKQGNKCKCVWGSFAKKDGGYSNSLCAWYGKGYKYETKKEALKGIKDNVKILME
jgi:hypothetical protein